jgi:hypothetical protein
VHVYVYDLTLTYFQQKGPQTMIQTYIGALYTGIFYTRVILNRFQMTKIMTVQFGPGLFVKYLFRR